MHEVQRSGRGGLSPTHSVRPRRRLIHGLDAAAVDPLL
ncbi:hypothetical protein HSB1_35770 [Halogranum salarium B-1]|uniref:Uncharacterized protein n=1 Tax=Halogranum salarium B-1 TaxID=1210908 RepID=J2ZBY0_9EURY|nr:hypothetical protein HSB1_35770 [Halogranum salarium B-1]